MSGSAGPVLVGLTGGIGSGKSEALRAFRRHGAATLSSDESVRSLYERGVVKRAVRDHFGEGVIGPDGAVDRAAGANDGRTVRVRGAIARLPFGAGHGCFTD